MLIYVPKIGTEHIRGITGFGASNSRGLNGHGYYPGSGINQLGTELGICTGALAFSHGPQSDTTPDYYRAAAWKDVSRKDILEAEARELRAELARIEGLLSKL